MPLVITFPNFWWPWTLSSIMKWLEVFLSLHMGRRLRDYGPFYLRFLAVLYSSEVLATLLLERRLWVRLLSKLILAICISVGLYWDGS